MSNERMDSKSSMSRSGARPVPMSGEAKGARGGDAGYITAEDIRREATHPSGAASAETGATAIHHEPGSDAGKRYE